MNDTIIDALFGHYDDATAGCALAVVHGDDVLVRGFGLADIESAAPVTPSTRFNLGSTSKQFTALAIMLLEADGLLSLDDDVRRHLPELHDFGSPITLRNLLHHTSGLRDTYPDALMLSGWRMKDYITQSDCLDLIFDQRELSFAPGSEHLYVNANYVLLAEVIARRSGGSLAGFARERMFDPLGMADTLIMDDVSKLIRGRAQSYFEEGTSWRSLPLTDEVLGSTNVYSTADDMARWLTNLRTHRLGGTSVWERMLQPGVLTDGTVLEYAGGLQVGPSSTYRGRPVVEHGGQHGGYCTSMYWFPEDDLGIALMLNHYVGDSRGRLLRVADLFLAGEETAAPPAPVPERRFEMDEAELAVLAGTFFDAKRRAVREVPLIDGELRYMGLKLVPIDRGKFTFEEASDVEVIIDEAGITLHTDQVYSYARVETQQDDVDLGEFIGRYESAELGVVWRITGADDRLRVERHRYADTLMRWLFGDTFLDDWLAAIGFPYEYLVEFERRDGRVTGLRVSGPRARGIWFERIET